MKLLSLVALVALVAVTSGYDACSMKLVVPEDFSIFTKFSQMRGGRISQGMQAATGQFPFTARLEFLSTESLVICSGSLVSEKFVLGARHCVGDTVISSAAVALGSGDWDNPQQRVWISVFHWNANSAVDLAIFELHTTANFNINIQPIRLPRQSLTSVDNIIAFASEWGDTSTGFPKFVHFTTLRVLSNFECLKLHNNGWLDDSRMCAVGLTNSRQGICGGDNGGGLAMLENDGQYSLIGINFIPLNGCAGNSASIFTRVSSFLTYINAVTRIPLR